MFDRYSRVLYGKGRWLHRKVLWRWLLVLSYAACIFIGSAVPGQDLPHLDVSDKVLHAAEFGALAFLLCRALRAQLPNQPPYIIALLSILATMGYGAVDEAHQLLVAQRMTEFGDFVADSFGATLAAWGWLQIGKRLPWLQ
jgi:VanZ family protein